MWQVATLPLKSSHKEQPSVIRLLWAKELSANAIQFEMRLLYNDKYFTRPAIHAWCKKFAHGRESVVDEEEPGRRVVSDAMITAVDAVKPACDWDKCLQELGQYLKQELSCRKQIARQLHTEYVEGIYRPN